MGDLLVEKEPSVAKNVMMAKSVDENGEKLRANEKWHGIGSLCESLGSNLN